jgi:glutamate N-acetyltransferase / amino-acid N-acetyltransferase
MSVGLKFPESILPIKGIRLSTACANLYSHKRTDVTLIELSEGSNVAAVFTKNLFCAAPVQIAKKYLSEFKPHYLLINAGNANAGTGDKGLIDAIDTCKALADLTGCKEGEVLPFSTGVIGEDLPVDKIDSVLPILVGNLSVNSWIDAAKAIMTTDTIPKAISKTILLGDSAISITGIVKGSGMIRPDMATMLAFIATDANITKDLLDNILSHAVNKSFNRITVDGDTSTNDACVLIATGKASHECIDNENSKEYSILVNAFTSIFCELAQAIIRDGEGVTKFISVRVCGGNDQAECTNVAYKIAESPLVKTAFTASDANWGRIIAAIGNSDVNDLNINNVEVFLDESCIVRNGKRASSYTEEEGNRIMQQDEITLMVNLNRGDFQVEIWTTDLSHEYITINAEYRT